MLFCCPRGNQSPLFRCLEVCWAPACCQAARFFITNPTTAQEPQSLRTSLGVHVFSGGSKLTVLLMTKLSMAYRWAQQGHCLAPLTPNQAFCYSLGGRLLALRLLGLPLFLARVLFFQKWRFVIAPRWKSGRR